MTRETKIGLLVGLAFIIVIGILLSDHLSSSTEPPTAALQMAGNDVRRTITIPGAQNAGGGVAVAPVQNTPRQPVPTQEEVSGRPQPVTIVRINTPAVQQPANPASAITVTPPAGGSGAADQVAGADLPHTPTTPETSGNPALDQIARQHGESLVSASGNNAVKTNVVAGKVTDTAADRGVRVYKAEPGDNLSRMAEKLLGKNTKANRDLIIKANPSLAADPNKIIIGQSYNVPSANGAPAPVAPVVAIKTPAPVAPKAGESVYTVKPGDNLYRIAEREAGGVSMLAALRELNKDVLKGSDVVRPNMKLRLPPRAVASAQ